MMRVDDDREYPNNSFLVHVVVRVINSVGLLTETIYLLRVYYGVQLDRKKRSSCFGGLCMVV